MTAGEISVSYVVVKGMQSTAISEKETILQFLEISPFGLIQSFFFFNILTQKLTTLEEIKGNLHKVRALLSPRKDPMINAVLPGCAMLE